MDPLAQNQGNPLPCDTCSACGACDFSENTFTFNLNEPESFTPQLKTLFAGRDLAARNDGAFIIRLGEKVIMGQKRGSEFKGTVVGPKPIPPENTQTETQTPLLVATPVLSETFSPLPDMQPTEAKNDQQPSRLTIVAEAIAHHQTQKVQTEGNNGKTNISLTKDTEDEMILSPVEYTDATTTADFHTGEPATGDITHLSSPDTQPKQAESSGHSIQTTSHEEPIFLADTSTPNQKKHTKTPDDIPANQSTSDAPQWEAATTLSDLPILESATTTEQPPAELENVQQPVAQTEQPADEPTGTTEQSKLVETHTEARRAVFAFLTALAIDESRPSQESSAFDQKESDQQTTEITLAFPDHPDALVQQFLIGAQARLIPSENPLETTHTDEPKNETIEEQYELREGTTSWIITLIREQDKPVTLRAEKEAVQILKKRLEKHLAPLLSTHIDEGAEEERITDPQPKPSHSIADPLLVYASWLAYAWLVETLQYTHDMYPLASTPVYSYS